MAPRTASDLASFLSGSWRLDPPPLPASQAGSSTLKVLAPLLLGAGLAPLGWWKIRRCELSRTPEGQELHQAFCRQALTTALQEGHMERLVLGLREAGVEPLVLKGWASARLYPHGLRPLGDLDLLVRPEQHAAAVAVLAALDAARARPATSDGPPQGFLGPLVDPSVDLKGKFPAIYERSEAELFETSSSVPLRASWVGVLAPEEHLRMLCLHFLRHGAWRALWLCDIAALVEGRPANFDWDRCLRGSRSAQNWVLCAIGLAHQMLGAEVHDTPAAHRASHLPRWLVPAVLNQWRAPRYYQNYQIGPGTPMMQALPNPLRVAQALAERWPNPVTTALQSDGILHDVPAISLQFFPRQITHYLGRGGRFLGRFPRLLRDSKS